MKSLYQFNAISSGAFLFRGGGIENKEATSTNTEQNKSSEKLTEKQTKKLDKQQKIRVNDEIINKAIEAVEGAAISFGYVGSEESMLSTGRAEGIDFPEGFEGIPASAFLKRSPATVLYSLFVDSNGVVNFHGNSSAKMRIGAGDIFGSDQEFIKINGVVGQRSIDPKFHGSKVGYVTKKGKYLPITGGETISTDVSGEEKVGFGTTAIMKTESYERKDKDGTVIDTLYGEAAYQAQFLDEVGDVEEYEKLDWEEKVQKSDEKALNAKVDLSRLSGGNEKMGRTIGRILAHKDEYLYIQAETGVPWMLVAAIHTRESSNKFNTYLHNGELLGKPTTLVPKGIFFEKGQWKEAAVDAIQRIKSSNNEFSSLNPNSSLGEMALFAESYNGLGYRNRDLPSPYVYSGTDRYTKGKYVADGVFDGSVVDQQLGVMPIILALRGYE